MNEEERVYWTPEMLLGLSHIHYFLHTPCEQFKKKIWATGSAEKLNSSFPGPDSCSDIQRNIKKFVEEALETGTYSRFNSRKTILISMLFAKNDQLIDIHD